jgi:DNA-binding response OmpR family regulator
LTARDATNDKVRALDAGADDYLVKPFSFQELSARIRALLRRPEETLPARLQVGDLILDANKRLAYHRDREIKLTLKEYSLLDYFMRHPGEVLSREDILDHLWGFDFEGFSNVVDVHIKNLRKKLDDGEDIYLETVQGVGYRLKE